MYLWDTLSMKMRLIIQEAHGFYPKDFRSMEELCKYHLEFQDSSHYELIEGQQQLYFDFDGKASGTSLSQLQEKLSETIDLIQVIDRIYSFLSYYNVRYVILIYSSSDTVKQSYHVVVKGIHFTDHVDCGNVAKQVMSGVTGFDSTIYTSRRNLRMMGSRKRDGTRIKRFHSCYNFGYFLDTPESLPNSFVTNIDLTRSISLYTNVNEMELRPKGWITECIWNDIKIDTGLTLVNRMFPNVFRKGKVGNNSIHLLRLKPFHCPLCERTHNSDGAELILKRNGTYHLLCWRNEDKKLLQLDEKEETLEIEVVEDEEKVEEVKDKVQAIVERIKSLCHFV